MPEYQQRVRDELNELIGRALKLNAFIGESPIFASLDVDEQRRLVIQLYVMRQYEAILEERIDHF